MQAFRWLQHVKVYGYLTICLAIVACLFACAPSDVDIAPVPPDSELGKPNAPSTEDYQIGAEDVVEVMVWKNEDLSRVVNVRPDGKILLPLIGDLQAAGKTAETLTDLIAEALKQYYKEPPPVSVIVQQVNS